MKVSRETLLELAEKAGYGIQTNCWASDGGTKCDTFEKNIWGGPMETTRLVRFAELLEQQLVGMS